MGRYNAKKRKTVSEDVGNGGDEPEEKEASEGASKDVKAITKRLNRLEFVSVMHEDRISSLESWATRTWVFPKDHPMAKKVMEAMEEWKELRPKKGPHPRGPPRTAVAMAIATYMTEDAEHQRELKVFKEHVQKEVKDPMRLGDVSIQMGSGRLTKPQAKDGEEKKEAKFLLQLRPSNIGTAQGAWREIFEVIDSMAESTENADMLTDKAPPVGASRDMKKDVNKRGKGKNKGKDKVEEEMDDA